mmetsp:Transcript_2833/g.7779  ORF Transcript_2833/g.7779 Transcript_2833/m.7779 type:complete len:80 (-) Transcript_2833:95-334(-)
MKAKKGSLDAKELLSVAESEDPAAVPLFFSSVPLKSPAETSTDSPCCSIVVVIDQSYFMVNGVVLSFVIVCLFYSKTAI